MPVNYVDAVLRDLYGLPGTDKKGQQFPGYFTDRDEGSLPDPESQRWAADHPSGYGSIDQPQPAPGGDFGGFTANVMPDWGQAMNATPPIGNAAQGVMNDYPAVGGFPDTGPVGADPMASVGMDHFGYGVAGGPTGQDSTGHETMPGDSAQPGMDQGGGQPQQGGFEAPGAQQTDAWDNNQNDYGGSTQ